MTKRGYGAARRLPRLAPFESRGLAKHATKAPRPVPHELLHLEVDELDAVLAEDGARGLDVAQQPSPEDLRPHLVGVRVRVRVRGRVRVRIRASVRVRVSDWCQGQGECQD